METLRVFEKAEQTKSETKHAGLFSDMENIIYNSLQSCHFSIGWEDVDLSQRELERIGTFVEWEDEHKPGDAPEGELDRIAKEALRVIESIAKRKDIWGWRLLGSVPKLCAAIQRRHGPRARLLSDLMRGSPEARMAMVEVMQSYRGDPAEGALYACFTVPVDLVRIARGLLYGSAAVELPAEDCAALFNGCCGLLADIKCLSIAISALRCAVVEQPWLRPRLSLAAILARVVEQDVQEYPALIDRCARSVVRLLLAMIEWDVNTVQSLALDWVGTTWVRLTTVDRLQWGDRPPLTSMALEKVGPALIECLAGLASAGALNMAWKALAVDVLASFEVFLLPWKRAAIGLAAEMALNATAGEIVQDAPMLLPVLATAGTYVSGDDAIRVVAAIHRLAEIDTELMADPQLAEWVANVTGQMELPE
jgi:hypothetical protein